MRPAFVDPKGQQTILPWIPRGSVIKRPGEIAFGSVTRGFFKGMHSPTASLGEFLAGLPLGAYDDKLKGEGVEMYGGSVLVNNAGFRRIIDLN